MTVEGPRPLARRMGLFGVLFLTLSAATPAASSLFVIVPDVVREAGTGALLAMALAALAAAAMAQVYAELSSAFPYAGGEYAIAAPTEHAQERQQGQRGEGGEEGCAVRHRPHGPGRGRAEPRRHRRRLARRNGVGGWAAKRGTWRLTAPADDASPSPPGPAP